MQKSLWKESDCTNRVDTFSKNAKCSHKITGKIQENHLRTMKVTLTFHCHVDASTHTQTNAIIPCFPVVKRSCTEGRNASRHLDAYNQAHEEHAVNANYVKKNILVVDTDITSSNQQTFPKQLHFTLIH